MTLIYRAGWTGARLFFFTYFRGRYVHPERVPKTGAAILAANHASYLDPFFIGAGPSREINYLARETLFRFPGIGALLRSLNAVPVDRDGGGGAGLKGILNRLLAGGAIVLFPEGTRTHDGGLQPARSGVGLIVLKSTAPVIPVCMTGSYEAFNRRMLVPRPRRMRITYGTPTNFDDLRAEGKACSKLRLKAIYQEVADQIMEQIAALQSSESLFEKRVGG